MAKIGLSFGGAGFLGVYHMGVAECLVQNGKNLLAKTDKFAGTSSGALVAAVLATQPNKIQDSFPWIRQVVSKLRQGPFGALSQRYYLLEDIRKHMEVVLPSDCHVVANERLYISITNLKSNKNELVSNFASHKELIDCLLCSCFLPFFTGFRIPAFKQVKCADGGFTNYLPVFDDRRTIKVSPFSGNAEISPNDPAGWGMKITLNKHEFNSNHLNRRRVLHSLYPPPVDVLQKYFENGFNDALKLLKTEQWHQENLKVCQNYVSAGT